MLKGLLRSRVPDLLLHVHCHRPFPVHAGSSWIRHWSFLDDLSAQGIPALPRGKGSVEDFRHYMPGLDDARFARVFGQQALEYWLWKKGPRSRFVGCSTYRRYLMVDQCASREERRVVKAPTPQHLASVSSEAQRAAALRFLASADLVTNRPWPMPVSIEQQYLASQPAVYWDLFLEGIDRCLPAYRRHLVWLRHYNTASVETTYLMRREWFVRYARELFLLLEYVFRHAPVVVPEAPEGAFQPAYRYPGFLGERFLPFFAYANGLRRIEVPLVVFADPEETPLAG